MSHLIIEETKIRHRREPCKEGCGQVWLGARDLLFAAKLSVPVGFTNAAVSNILGEECVQTVWCSENGARFRLVMIRAQDAARFLAAYGASPITTHNIRSRIGLHFDLDLREVDPETGHADMLDVVTRQAITAQALQDAPEGDVLDRAADILREKRTRLIEERQELRAKIEQITHQIDGLGGFLEAMGSPFRMVA